MPATQRGQAYKLAEVLFERLGGNGFLPGLRLAESEVFVMPGTYESLATAEATMQTLAERWRGPSAVPAAASKSERPIG